MSKSQIDEYLSDWTYLQFYIWIAFTVFCSVFGYLFLFAALNILNINLVLILSVLNVILMFFRPYIIKKIFHNIKNETLLSISKIPTQIYVFCFFFIIIYIIDNNFNLNIIKAENFIEILLAIIFLTFPISPFIDILSEKGKLKTQFKLLHDNINDYDTRQNYLKDILKKVEDRLKKGYINIPHKKLMYSINIQLDENYDETLNVLENIEEWLTNEDRKITIIDKLKKILSEKDITYFKQDSIISEFRKMPSEHIKWISIVIITIIIMIKKPELLGQLIEKLTL
jgi:hypothetical protein